MYICKGALYWLFNPNYDYISKFKNEYVRSLSHLIQPFYTGTNVNLRNQPRFSHSIIEKIH